MSKPRLPTRPHHTHGTVHTKGRHTVQTVFRPPQRPSFARPHGMGVSHGHGRTVRCIRGKGGVRRDRVGGEPTRSVATSGHFFGMELFIFLRSPSNTFLTRSTVESIPLPPTSAGRPASGITFSTV